MYLPPAEQWSKGADRELRNITDHLRIFLERQ